MRKQACTLQEALGAHESGKVCVGGGALSERAEGRQPGGNAELVR